LIVIATAIKLIKLVIVLLIKLGQFFALPGASKLDVRWIKLGWPGRSGRKQKRICNVAVKVDPF
jgi:hypothetical protein